MTTLWFAPTAKVEIGPASGTAIASGDTIAVYMTALTGEKDYTSYVKNFKLSGGERDVDALKLVGYTEQLDEKRSTVKEATFTTWFEGGIATANPVTADFSEMMMGQKVTITGNYRRTRGGEYSTASGIYTYGRLKKDISIQFTDGTRTIQMLMQNAYCTSRELSLDAEGHVEQTVTFKCLASDYYEEDDYA